MRILFNTIARYISGAFKDTFNRANTTGGLGTSSSGIEWTTVNPGIEVVDNNAESSSIPGTGAVASQYPISVVDMGSEDNTITIYDTNNGAAAAIWVQSSTDWWMVSVDATFNVIPGATNYTAGGLIYTMDQRSIQRGQQNILQVQQTILQDQLGILQVHQHILKDQRHIQQVQQPILLVQQHILQVQQTILLLIT